MNSIYTISILEDSHSFSKLVATTLDSHSEFSVQNIAYNIAEAKDTFLKLPTDIYLIDLSLPDGSGIEIIELLKTKLPNAFFLVCTSFDDDEKVLDAIKAGANGYIVKNDDDIDLIKAVQELLNGGAPMSSGIASKVLKIMYLQYNEAINELDCLSDKENEVLVQLSNGFLYKEIADNQQVTINTIKKHCGSIYKKLHVQNRTEAINKYFGR